MVDVRHFETGGRDHFQEWFVALDNKAALEVSKAVYRLELGNFSNLKSLGGGRGRSIGDQVTGSTSLKKATNWLFSMVAVINRPKARI